MIISNIKEEINKFKIAIDESNSIAIASHLSPDGDNLGSITATYGMLKNLGKNPVFILDDEIPKSESFLPYINSFVNPKDIKNKEFDLFISLDCADLQRMGSNIKPFFIDSKKTVNIDHHSTNDFFSEINIVNVNATATCEVLYDIFTSLKYPIDKNIATSLYTGISSDTGSFKYDSVKSKTFKIAADLLMYNINFNEINVSLYQSRSKEKTDLLIRALNSIEYYHNNQIAIVSTTIEDFNKTNASKLDSEGIVEFVRDIEGVEVAILLKEKRDSVRLSLRSKSFVNCAKVASQFNGGGHIRAAGGTFFELSMKQAKEYIIETVLEEFDK